MPCSDGPSDAEMKRLRESERSERGRSYERALAELRAQNNFLAALLCDSCLRLENAGKLELLGPVVQEWWRGHKEFDRRKQDASPDRPV